MASSRLISISHCAMLTSRLAPASRSLLVRQSPRYLAESKKTSPPPPAKPAAAAAPRATPTFTPRPGLAGQHAGQLFTKSFEQNALGTWRPASAANSAAELRPQVQRLNKALEVDYDLRMFLANTDSTKLPVHPLLRSLIGELQTTRKSKHLQAVLAHFERIAQEVHNEISLEITLPDEKITEQELKQKVDFLCKTFIRPEFKVHSIAVKHSAAVLGGVVIRSDDHVLDLSINDQIEAFVLERRNAAESQTMKQLVELEEFFQAQLQKIRPPTEAMIADELDKHRQQLNL